MAKEKDLSCSFCNKSPGEVRKLIAGPSTYICNECVVLCMGIISGVDIKLGQEGPPEVVLRHPRLDAQPAQVIIGRLRDGATVAEMLDAYRVLAQHEHEVLGTRERLARLEVGLGGLRYIFVGLKNHISI